jgi:Protein of unknown function (DUF4232)
VRRGLASVAIFFAFVAIFTLSRHHTTTVTTTTTTAFHAATTTTTSNGATTTSTLAVAACQGSAFSGVYNEGEGAAGTVYASVTLTKTTPGMCAVTGWPLLTLQDKSGALLPVNLVDVPSAGNTLQFSTAKANRAPSQVVLHQGSVTNFSLAYSSVATANTACDNALTLNIQFAANGSAVPVTAPYAVQPCDNGKVWISPFY